MSNTLNDIKEFESLSKEEKDYVLKMLKEIQDTGSSDKFTDLMYDDYSEIPVGIEEFLMNDKYLGNAWHDTEGKSKLYPFWLETLKKLFPDNVSVSVNNFIESGARGIGKSEVAVGILAYMMYRVMCLKNPLEHFGLKPTEKICFAFMNITKTLAEDIGISKFQHTIQLSPWFMAKGKMTKRNNEDYWIPPDPIQVIIGSHSGNVIGQPIYACLDGDTVIKTTNGYHKIKHLVDKEIKVFNMDEYGDVLESDICTVKVTGMFSDALNITLSNNSTINCTLNHRFMLSSGEYMTAECIEVGNCLMDENGEPIEVTSVEEVHYDTPKKFYDVINAFPYNNFLIKTNGKDIVSHNCFFDEINKTGLLLW